MNRRFSLLFVASLTALVSFTVSGQAPDQPQKGFLSVVTKGQSVNVKDVAGRFEISTFGDGLTALNHKVIEVGPDYMLLEDIAGVGETRIPVYSIKSIVKLNFPTK